MKINIDLSLNKEYFEYLESYSTSFYESFTTMPRSVINDFFSKTYYKNKSYQIDCDYEMPNTMDKE